MALDCANPPYSGGAPQIAFRPDDRERPDQIVDVGLAVQRRGRQAQPLRAARHGRVVDRLHINPVALQQLVADGLAQGPTRGVGFPF